MVGELINLQAKVSLSESCAKLGSVSILRGADDRCKSIVFSSLFPGYMTTGEKSSRAIWHGQSRFFVTESPIRAISNSGSNNFVVETLGLVISFYYYIYSKNHHETPHSPDCVRADTGFVWLRLSGTVDEEEEST